MMPRSVYEKLVKGYNEKQWGVSTHSLSASLAKRFDVREDDESRLMRHKCFGRLKYRGQQRTHKYLPDVDFVQPCGQVNNPDPANGPYIRTLEWKHMMQPEFASRIRGTVLTREVTVTPDNPHDYEYPFPGEANARLYAKYRERTKAIPTCSFVDALVNIAIMAWIRLLHEQCCWPSGY